MEPAKVNEVYDASVDDKGRDHEEQLGSLYCLYCLYWLYWLYWLYVNLQKLGNHWVCCWYQLLVPVVGAPLLAAAAFSAAAAAAAAADAC